MYYMYYCKVRRWWLLLILLTFLLHGWLWLMPFLFLFLFPLLFHIIILSAMMDSIAGLGRMGTLSDQKQTASLVLV